MSKFFLPIPLFLFFCLLVSPFLAQGAVLTPDEKNTVAIFENAADSVVFITNFQQARTHYYGVPGEIPRGTGSGFIWDHQGHVITNFHVVQKGDRFYINLRDGSRYRAKLIGSEPRKDLAVLKIIPEKKQVSLKPIQVGSSKDLIVGQKALAIGNPYGFDQTLTVGVVSALGREIMGVGRVTIRDVIQTDADINPGNSGGPLLNSTGQLIGMNTAIYSTSGANSGIGFAVPVDAIKEIIPQIIQYGKVTQPGLGVSIFGDKKTHQIPGVAIKSVEPGSAADKAGLRGMAMNRYGQRIWGDIIVGLGDTRIETYNDLYHTLSKYKVGERIKVRVLRGQSEVEVPVELQRL